MKSRLTALEAGGSSNVEVGYAEITANQTTTATSEQDVTGLSVTFVAGSRPVVVEFSGVVRHTTAGQGVGMYITDSANVVKAFSWTTIPIANGEMPCVIKARLGNLVAGQTYTYKVRFRSFSAGTATVAAAATFPAKLHAVQV